MAPLQLSAELLLLPALALLLLLPAPADSPSSSTLMSVLMLAPMLVSSCTGGLSCRAESPVAVNARLSRSRRIRALLRCLRTAAEACRTSLVCSAYAAARAHVYWYVTAAPSSCSSSSTSWPRAELGFRPMRSWARAGFSRRRSGKGSGSETCALPLLLLLVVLMPVLLGTIRVALGWGCWRRGLLVSAGLSGGVARQKASLMTLSALPDLVTDVAGALEGACAGDFPAGLLLAAAAAKALPVLVTEVLLLLMC